MPCARLRCVRRWRLHAVVTIFESGCDFRWIEGEGRVIGLAFHIPGLVLNKDVKRIVIRIRRQR